MAGPDRKLIAAVEAYFADLGRVRASGGATGERSYYPALANLFGAVGRTLKPKVFCVLEGADQGAGPDFAVGMAGWQADVGRRARVEGETASKAMGDPNTHILNAVTSQEVQHFADTPRRIGALLTQSQGPRRETL